MSLRRERTADSGFRNCESLSLPQDSLCARETNPRPIRGHLALLLTRTVSFRFCLSFIMIPTDRVPDPTFTTRRDFLRCAAGALSAVALASSAGSAETASGFRPLFDGRTLQGWRAVPRLVPPKALLEDASLSSDELVRRATQWASEHGNQAIVDHTGRWEVVDHAIAGGRSPVNSNRGCYLRSDEKFGDFELELEARPDWPVDTGIMIRSHALPNIGYQILLDHRPNGGMAGVYGNSLGAFIAAPLYVTGDEAPGLRVEHLRVGQKPATNAQPVPMQHAAPFAEFAKVWRPNDWNRFRIRCVGELPVITTWVNELKMCELDVSTVQSPGFKPAQARRLLGRSGHIAFEVHDAGSMGRDRWAEGAVCRWRNIRIRTL